MSLNETLASLGFTTKPAGNYKKHIVDATQTIVFTGDAQAVWEWLAAVQPEKKNCGNCRNYNAENGECGFCSIDHRVTAEHWTCDEWTHQTQTTLQEK